MSRLSGRVCVVLVWCGLMAETVVGVHAQQGELLAEESAGIVAVDGESRLRVVDVRGEILVRPGKDDELRFLSTVLGSPREETPIQLSQDDDTFWLHPPPGTESDERRLEVSVPSRFWVSVATENSKVAVAAVDGRVEIEGAGLETRLGGLGDAAELQLTGGSLSVRGVARDLTLRGEGLEVEVSGVGGLAFLVLRGGRARVTDNAGEVDLDLDDVELEVAGSKGPFRLDARGGKAEISALEAGGEINLESTPAILTGCRGDLDIESDAEIGFRDNEASIHVMGYGASLRGSGNNGLLEIVTHGADITLENVKGPVRVQGDGLQVSMQEIGGEILVMTTSSDIHLRGTRSSVTVENEYGDVTLSQADEKVTITNRDGNVYLTEMKTEVQVEADGDEVSVSWASLDPNAGTSTIRNEGGGVSVALPARGGCAVRATSQFGRIESELEDIVVSDDGSSAQGQLNRRSRPVVVIESEGPVMLGPTQTADTRS